MSGAPRTSARDGDAPAGEGPDDLPRGDPRGPPRGDGARRARLPPRRGHRRLRRRLQGHRRAHRSEFGEERVIDTPIAETAIVGAAIGAAMMGMRPVAEMQFIDFISCAFDMIMNFAAKSRYRTGVGVPLVVRGPSGGGVHGGPFHSQNPEAYFVHTPGLKIVAPGDGLRRQGPHQGRDPRRRPGALPRAQVPLPAHQGGAAGRTTTSCRSARPPCAAPGRDLSIVTYGAMVWTRARGREDARGRGHRRRGPRPAHAPPAGRGGRSSSPSRRRTRPSCSTRPRARAASAPRSPPSSPRTRFEYLDGPVVRVTAPDTPVPYSPAARGVLPAERREGLPGGAGARGVLRPRSHSRRSKGSLAALGMTICFSFRNSLVIPRSAATRDPFEVSLPLACDITPPCTSRARSRSRRPARRSGTSSPIRRRSPAARRASSRSRSSSPARSSARRRRSGSAP